jgi:hypothetical protein
MKITGFECCFCKKSIEENEIDPCDINIIINSEMKKGPKERCSQNFYSHFQCLKERLHKDIQGYFVLDTLID